MLECEAQEPNQIRNEFGIGALRNEESIEKVPTFVKYLCYVIRLVLHSKVKRMFI